MIYRPESYLLVFVDHWNQQHKSINSIHVNFKDGKDKSDLQGSQYYHSSFSNKGELFSGLFSE